MPEMYRWSRLETSARLDRSLDRQRPRADDDKWTAGIDGFRMEQLSITRDGDGLSVDVLQLPALRVRSCRSVVNAALLTLSINDSTDFPTPATHPSPGFMCIEAPTWRACLRLFESGPH